VGHRRSRVPAGRGIAGEPQAVVVTDRTVAPIPRDWQTEWRPATRVRRECPAGPVRRRTRTEERWRPVQPRQPRRSIPRPASAPSPGRSRYVPSQPQSRAATVGAITKGLA
jgi:hypothetical protein